jgi:hypothetical protein
VRAWWSSLPQGRLPTNELTLGGVGAMMQNIVAGCVMAALIFMGVLAYAQKHDEFCIHGHLFKTHKPCGSVSAEM